MTQAKSVSIWDLSDAELWAEAERQAASGNIAHARELAEFDVLRKRGIITRTMSADELRHAVAAARQAPPGDPT